MTASIASARKPVEKIAALHAVAREVVEDVGDEGSLDDRRHGLGHAGGDRTQPRALAADEDDGLPRDASRRDVIRGSGGDGRRHFVAQADALVLEPGRPPRRRGRRSCGRR